MIDIRLVGRGPGLKVGGLGRGTVRDFVIIIETAIDHNSVDGP